MDIYKKVTDPSQLPEVEYLTPEQLMELQHLLIDRKAGIVEETGKTVASLTNQQIIQPDEMDQASSESEREFGLRIAMREQRLITKIDRTLQTMLDGEYGECKSCGEPIGYRRLLVRPVAGMCIDCKTEAETAERISSFR